MLVHTFAGTISTGSAAGSARANTRALGVRPFARLLQELHRVLGGVQDITTRRGDSPTSRSYASAGGARARGSGAHVSFGPFRSEVDRGGAWEPPEVRKGGVFGNQLPRNWRAEHEHMCHRRHFCGGHFGERRPESRGVLCSPLSITVMVVARGPLTLRCGDVLAQCIRSRASAQCAVGLSCRGALCAGVA